MIAGLVSAALLVPLFVGAKKGEWGVVAVCGVLIVLVIAGAVISAMDARAWVNRTSYWSKSGKDRAKLRHKWEAQARREEEEERARHREQWRARQKSVLWKEEKQRLREMEAEAKAMGMSVEEYDAYVESEQVKAKAERIVKKTPEELFICKHCKKEVLGKVALLPTEDGVIRFCTCPICKRQTYVVQPHRANSVANG